LLPARFPYVSEFRRALELDPANAELRRDLGFLLLKMDREEEAEPEFQILVETPPDDLLSATQLAFLLNARGETDAPSRCSIACWQAKTWIWPTVCAPCFA